MQTVIKSFISLCNVLTAPGSISGTCPVMAIGQCPNRSKKLLISFTYSTHHHVHEALLVARLRHLVCHFEIAAGNTAQDRKPYQIVIRFIHCAMLPRCILDVTWCCA